MPLTRRRVLQSVAAATAGGLAGCVTGLTDDGDDNGDGGESGNPGDFERFDDPPGEIAEPDFESECPPVGDEHDPLYLCETTAAEPTLAFEQVETNRPVLYEEGLEWTTPGPPPSPQYYATLLTEPDDLDRIFQDGNHPALDLIEETTFDSEAVLVAEIGWPSPEVTPHLKRIESTADGVHAFGCYRRPCEQSDQLGDQTVVARFQRPETLEVATVSLVNATDGRVTFRSTEGVVSPDSEP